MSGRPQIVVLGMMTKMPVAGVLWETLHYLIGLERLGYETFYVEAHARTPSMLMQSPEDDGSAKAAELIDRVLRRVGLGDRWAFHALHDDGRCYGLSLQRLRELYREAALIINLYGGTAPQPEHAASGRLIYLETDPVDTQIELYEGRQDTIDHLAPHAAFFTWAENYGRPGCRLPVDSRFRFMPTRMPIILDWWKTANPPTLDAFTTVASWRQPWREIVLDGEQYSWSKHHEFLKVIELPSRVTAQFELALGALPADDRELLEQHGWRVRDAGPLSLELDPYRDFIRASRGEFTVAKDQNVRLRTGWFSDRSATYLATGRPVITQDTAFDCALPTGRGLLTFTTLDEAVEAIQAVQGDYDRHSDAAREIAREYFDSDVVLGSLLDRIGVERPRHPFPSSLQLTPLSRRPVVLPPESLHSAATSPIYARPSAATMPQSSIVIVSHNNVVFTRLCLESLLANADGDDFEVIVVDNGSRDGSVDYLRALQARDTRVHLLENAENTGFPHACNQGLRLTRSERLVVLNNDTIVPRGVLAGLLARLDDPAVGLVGPVTNRIGNEAEIEVDYETYGGLLDTARELAQNRAGERFELPMLALYCVALRRHVYMQVGPLDEQYEVGMFEDDDYSRRVIQAGYRVICASDVFVHHFGEGSFGSLVASGERDRLFRENRRKYEEKWSDQWQTHRLHVNGEYDLLVERIRECVDETLPRDASIAVVSKGDDRLLDLGGRSAWHFPLGEDGGWAGFYPAGSEEAIVQIEALRARGADFLLFPAPAFWWLDQYAGLRDYLEQGSLLVAGETCRVYALAPGKHVLNGGSA